MNTLSIEIQKPHFIYGMQKKHDVKPMMVDLARSMYATFCKRFKLRPFYGAVSHVIRDVPVHRLSEDTVRDVFEMAQAFESLDPRSKCRFFVVAHLYTAGVDQEAWAQDVGTALASDAGKHGMMVMIGKSWVHPDLYTYVVFAKSDPEYIIKIAEEVNL